MAMAMAISSEASALDNPFWSSLRTLHRGIAQTVSEVARYPAEYAPFLGISETDADVTDALDALVAPGESVYLIGVAPRHLPDRWKLEAFRPLAQMICTSELEVIDGPEI